MNDSDKVFNCQLEYKTNTSFDSIILLIVNQQIHETNTITLLQTH